jgi:hypothetical protein
MKGDLRDSIEMTPAEAASTGLAAARNTVPAARSAVSITEISRRLDKKGSLKVEYNHCLAWGEETYRIFAAFLQHALDLTILWPIEDRNWIGLRLPSRLGQCPRESRQVF